MHRMFRAGSRILVALVVLTGLVFGTGDPVRFGPPSLVNDSVTAFNRPYGVALDGTRLVVVDSGNRKLKWADAARVRQTRVVSFSSVDLASGTGAESVASDGAGSVYVVNALAGTISLFRFSAGKYVPEPTFCGQALNTIDGVRIDHPRDIAVSSTGTVYLLDSGNSRVLVFAGPTDPNCWRTFKQDRGWSNPYGLTTDTTGAIFLADTGNHRVVKLDSTGNQVATYGRWGTGTGELRYPRDVAVSEDGLIIVSDTFNHRVQVLSSDGKFVLALGQAPAIGSLQHLVVRGKRELYAVDSDNNALITFRDPDTKPDFDLYVRDFIDDEGVEPSVSMGPRNSPDIIVRNRPDIDVSKIPTGSGLESFQSQVARYGENNYVYVSVRNRGQQVATGGTARVYWYAPSAVDPTRPYQEPEWRTDGFYESYHSDTVNVPSNIKSTGTVNGSGVNVIGPFLWRPPRPSDATQKFQLVVRVGTMHDFPPSSDTRAIVAASNNIAERTVEVTQAPSSVGKQNTLMVRVSFPDIPADAELASAEARAEDMKNWFKEVSYGAVEVNVIHRGPIKLQNARDSYVKQGNNPLIELTEEVVEQLAKTEPGILDGEAGREPITRLVLVTNDDKSPSDWATTRAWPYHSRGFPPLVRYLTVSVHGASAAAASFTHGMSHQLGLVDLLLASNVTSTRPYADGWDNMAQPMNNVHPLVWSKELAGWISARGSKVLFFPRPKAKSVWNNGGKSIGLKFQDQIASGEVAAIAIGLSDGVGSFSEETSFYYIEARKRRGYDTALPHSGGVLMYQVNTRIPSGQGPVIVLNNGAGGAPSAIIPVGGSNSPPGTGLTVAVHSGTGGADFDIQINYAPPPDKYDVHLRPGEFEWESPDIWVDSLSDGFYDSDQNLKPQDRGNIGIAGERNILYATVRNRGPGVAKDFEAMFKISEPYHTVNDRSAFDEYRSIFVDQLDANSEKLVNVEWVPRENITDPHTCVGVELRRMFNDMNATNNWAQRNLQVEQSQHGSPYTPVQFKFQVKNESATTELYYFRADGIPADWTWTVTPRKALVQPGQSASGVLELRPPDNAPDCLTHNIIVTGWKPSGDTLVRVGGTSVKVNLTKKTQLQLEVNRSQCSNEDFAKKDALDRLWRDPIDASQSQGSAPARIIEMSATSAGSTTSTAAANSPAWNKQPTFAVPTEFSLSRWHDATLSEIKDAQQLTHTRVVVHRRLDGRLSPFDTITTLEAVKGPIVGSSGGSVLQAESRCAKIVTSGCTVPAVPQGEILIRYARPDGETDVHRVITDAKGCFSDSEIPFSGGDWKVTADYQGTTCQGAASSTKTVQIPRVVGLIPDSMTPNENHSVCIGGRDGRVVGELVSTGKREATSCGEVKTVGTSVISLRAAFGNSVPGPTGSAGAADIKIDSYSELSAGAWGRRMGTGRFHWKTADGVAVGQVHVTSAINAAYLTSPKCSQNASKEDLSADFDGVYVDGLRKGSRLRATAEMKLGPALPKGSGSGIDGRITILSEFDCDEQSTLREQRAALAFAGYQQMNSPPMCNAAACVGDVKLSGEGHFILDQTERTVCKEASQTPFKTWGRFEGKLKSISGNKGSGQLGDATITVENMLSLFQQKDGGVAEQFGRFELVDQSGNRVVGEMQGVRTPEKRPQAKSECDAFSGIDDTWSGRLTGIVSAGAMKGMRVNARYLLGYDGKPSLRRRVVRLNIDGWQTEGCLGALK